MRLKTAKFLLLAACLLVAAALVLCAVTKAAWIGYLGIAFALAGAGVWLAFGRCESCGRFLGRMDGRYCPHCGAEIKW